MTLLTKGLQRASNGTESSVEDVFNTSISDTSASWSSSSNSNDNDDSENSSNEENLSLLIKTVLSGNVSFSESSNSWPSNLLLETQCPVKITHEQFQDIVMDKVAEIIIENSNLGEQLFDAKLIEMQLDFWQKKFQNSLDTMCLKHKQYRDSNLKPTNKVIHVRNVSVQVNFPLDP